MDQLLESVGMPVIDSALADVTQLHTSRYDRYVMPRP